MPSPTNKILKSVFFVNNQTGWAAGESGTIIKTEQGGLSWTLQQSNVETFITDIFFINENKGWALTVQNVFPFGTTILKTTNGGDIWTTEVFQDEDAIMNTIFFFDSLTGWIGGQYIAGTTDGGISWNPANIDSSMISGLPVYKFNFYSRQFGYACGGFIDLAGVVWRTTDYGQNWAAQGISPDEIFDLYILDSLNAITLSGDPEGLFSTANLHTTDAGLNWNFEELNTFGLSFAIDFRTETEGWSASGFKFMRTTDKGETWSDLSTPDSSVVYDLVFTDERTGYAVGENGIILKYIPDPVSVKEEDKNPDNFILYQNYPNPFNPSTKIRYSITPHLNPLFIKRGETGGFVSLKVYDVLGNEIAVIVNEEKTAGTYEVDFNGSDLPGGIYFYQLTAGGFVQTKKMTLLK